MAQTSPDAPDSPTSASLPVRRLTLYKHGVGVVERGGPFDGDELRLVFRASEVNDALKSLLVLDRNGGQILGIHYDTPTDQEARLAEGGINLSPDHALFDLIQSLRGAVVRLVTGSGTQTLELEGRLLGTEVAQDDPARRALVSLWNESRGAVAVLPLGTIREVLVRDDRAAQDVRYFLDTSRSEDTRRTVAVRLSPGEHDLAVSYLVPSPTWRVSYRLVAESDAAAGGGAGPGARPTGTLLLQGWGLFDNRLEEDLQDVQVVLVAGQPISFVYDLATSRIPPRRVVEDEARIAAAPVEVERALPKGAFRSGGRSLPPGAAPAPASFAAFDAAVTAMAPSMDDLAEQTTAAAGGESGELFQYQVAAPVTVGRGGSALVPILTSRLPYRRQLLFDEAKLPRHPVAAMRFANESGLVLERGPVTVLEDGDYRGEAIVPFSRQGSEVTLAYAVELGVTVSVSRSSRVEQAGLRIERTLLWTKQAQLTETEYVVASELDTAQVVTVEHGRLGGYDLVDTRPPDEQTAASYRWDVPCPARATTTFRVAERRFVWQQQALLDQSYEALSRFLERRWLDRPTLDRIGELLRERQAVTRREAEVAALQAERDRIYQREEQLRQNLAALSASGQEAALRERVFRQLEASEARLTVIDERIATLEEENRQSQASLDAALARLRVAETGDPAAGGAPPAGGDAS
jgi:hypothetical protein